MNDDSGPALAGSALVGLVGPLGGHAVVGAGCMPKLFAQFVEKADAKALDGKCLDKLGYTPPFTSFNGWEP